MSSPLLEQVTVLTASPNGRLPTAGAPLDEVDDRIEVIATESVADAVSRVGDGGVDCVVCVHDPPRIDGIECVRSVRGDDPSVPVLVVHPEEADVASEALEAGATDVVLRAPRSISTDVLANRIRQFVGAGSNDHSTQIDPSRTTGGDRKPARRENRSESDPLASLTETARDLRGLERKDDVADAVTDFVVDVLDVPGVGVFLFDAEQNDLRPVAITDAMEAYFGGNVVFGPGERDSITWHAFVTGETLAFDDIRESNRWVYDRTDARACLFVPLGEYGVLVVATEEVGGFQDPSRRVVELAGNLVESALARIERAAICEQAERRVRECEDRVRYLDRVNELVTAVERVLVAEKTRTGIETAVLGCLVSEDWFDFGWFGVVDVESDTLAPRRWTEDGSQYLDDLSLSVETSDEPACRTARDGAVTHVANVAIGLDGAGWERNALSHDLHSALGVPLAYDDVLYGVLTLYADRPDGFEEPIRTTLEQLGRTVACAINGAERRYCVLSNTVSELELAIEDPRDLLNVIARSIGTTIECLELSPLPNGSTELLFSAPDVSAESVLATTSGIVSVDRVAHVSSGDPHLFRAILGGEMVASHLATAGAVPMAITADGRSLLATVNLPETVDARTLVDRLERRYPDTKLVSRRERDQSTMTRTCFLDELETELTDRQLEVLRTAYQDGFFQSPRETTGQDIADRLGVSQPTISHHLREGQGKLFSMLFDED